MVVADNGRDWGGILFCFPSIFVDYKKVELPKIKEKKNGMTFLPLHVDEILTEISIWTTIDNELHHRVKINTLFTTGVDLKVVSHHRDQEKNLAFYKLYDVVVLLKF